MKIYTKTGDDGMTSLVGGERVPKTHLRLEAYGTVDELNSQLGLLSCLCEEETRSDFSHEVQLLENIQNQLFVVGSYLATNTDNRELRSYSILEEEAVLELVSIIQYLYKILDQMTLDVVIIANMLLIEFLQRLLILVLYLMKAHLLLILILLLVVMVKPRFLL